MFPSKSFRAKLPPSDQADDSALDGSPGLTYAETLADTLGFLVTEEDRSCLTQYQMDQLIL